MVQPLLINQSFPNETNHAEFEKLSYMRGKKNLEMLSPKMSGVYLTKEQFRFILCSLMYSLYRSKTADETKTCRNTAILTNLSKAEVADLLSCKQVNVQKEIKND